MSVQDPEPWNRVDVFFQFPEDKWMGLEGWQQDIELIEHLINRLFHSNRRGEVKICKSWRDMEDD